MHLVCVGISHHTAPVELRERLAMGRSDIDRALVELHERYQQAEVAILSTCNRTEVYVARPLHGHPRIEALTDWLADRCGADTQHLHEALYHYDNERAIRHLFRVACGLDSMVVGEQQIVAQIREAYEAAQRCETVGRALHRVFQAALATSKRTRGDSGIGQTQRSIASVAVTFAEHLFETLRDRTVLVVGAGDMAALTARQFRRRGGSRIVVCNRTCEHAEQIVQSIEGALAAPWDELDGQLAAADVIITSTAAAEPIITRPRFGKVTRARRFRPAFVIDIAVPRNVEPAVGDLPNVYLFDLDDLQQAAATEAGEHADHLAASEQVIEQAVGECYALVQTSDVSDMVRQLRRHLHALGRAEAQRTVRKLAAAADRNEADEPNLGRLVDEHTHRLINKLLHRPLVELSRGDSRTAALYATALRRLFDLGGGEDLSPPESTAPRSQQRDAGTSA